MEENKQIVRIYQFTTDIKRNAAEADINKYISNGYRVTKLKQSSNKYEHILTVVLEKE